MGAVTAAAANGSVTGTVFRDFNSNGAMDVAGGTGVAVDVGLTGVTATAYDRRNVSVGSATTAANGTYSITVTAADSTDLRVEFTGLPSGYYTSFHGSGAAGNHSSEQFVQIGATSVNYAANAPEDYSQSNPPVITAIQHAGLANSATLATEPAITAVPWNAGYSTPSGQGATFPNRTTLATVPQVGSIWGTAFQGTTNSLYAAASYKRHAGLGPGGLAEIYRITGVLGSNGAITTGTPTVTQWLNLQGKPIVGGGTMDLGTAATDAARGISTPTAPALDLDGYQKAGKIGIGAIAISSDQRTLYFVNLFDKNLYSIDISDPVAAATSPTITKYNLALGAGLRPWAVELYRGYIYVGYVDTGEALATPTSAAAASLHAHVIRASEAAPTVWSADLLNLDLGYTRGSPAGGGGANPVNPVNAARWNTWTDQWTWTGGSVATTWFGGGPIHVFPQPILSNLQFDGNGFVSLGFLDRASVQGGNRNHSTVVGDNTTYESLASGDLLMASQSTATGALTIENNGVAGARTGTGSAAQGPGGKEFYLDQQALNTGVIHQETTLGGLTGMGGVSEVVSSVYDPLQEIRVGGIDWLSTTNGAELRGYNQTLDAGGSANPDGSFQKGGGLGDIEALSDDAPIQIGNRVWLDADQDGIQDADEPAIQGLTVNLLQGATIIATRTTDASGEYYFSSTDADLAGELIADGGNYTVQFIKPTTGNVNIGSDTRFGTVAWADTSFTTTAAGANRAIDSNATPNVTDATKGEYVYTAGHVGVNDDTIDAGFKANGTLHVVKAIDPAGGTAPGGATYAMTLTATDFRGNSLSVGADASFSVGVGAGNAHDVSMPVGSFATIAEPADPTVKAVVISPTGAQKITGTGASGTTVTVTNTLYKPGTFSVQKTVSGEGAGLVASNASFTVEYTYAALAGAWVPMTVTRGGAAVTSASIPYNTVVTVRETPPTTPSNVIWGTPSWTVGASTVTAATKNITIGDGTNVAITLDNPTTVQRSGFTVTKQVTGSAAGSVPDTFSFAVNYSYVDLLGATQTGTLNVTKGGVTQTASLANIPVGTSVTLSEVTPTGAAPDVSWGTPTWSSNVTTNANGSATFVVGSSTVAVTLTNPTTQLLGGFSLQKVVTGSAAGSVANSQSFTVTYTYPGQATPQTLVVTKGSPNASVSGLPYGTVVTLSEATPTGAAPDVQWDTPTWSSNVTTNGNGTATFTIGATPVAVVLTNPTTQLTGGFSLAKVVTGSAAASVANSQSFTVTYTYPGQATPQTLVVTKGSPNASVSSLPLGTVVTLSEATPTGAAPDVQWNTPTWSNNVTTNGDGTATFTIGASPVAVVLTNPTTRLFSTLSVTKSVTGSAASDVPGAYNFTVFYSYTDVAGTHSSSVTVSKNSPTASLGSIPLGSTVTLSEGPRTGAPAVVSWGTPTWSAVGGSLTDNGDGTASVTVSSTTSIAIGLVNPTSQVLGGFNLSKVVNGSGAGSVSNGQAFTVTYTYPGQATPQSFVVTKGSPNASVGGIPLGTVVTLSEATPIGAPADVSWGTPTWSSNVTTNGDGTATFTVGASPISITLTNPTTQLLGGFTLAKVVTGPAAGSVDASQSFDVTYTYPGQGSPQTLTVTKGSPNASVTGLPQGTVVTLSEATPTGTPADVSWDSPTWSNNVTTNPDGTATFTVGAGMVGVVLTNPTTRLLGGFDLSKVVSGAAAGSVSPSQPFTVTYTFPGQASPETLVVTKGSPNASVGGIPLGTVVTLSEATPTGAPADVQWDPPTWSSNVTTNPDGSATFTVGTSPVAVVLTNPTTRLFSDLSVTKSVTGAAASAVPSGFTFTVFFSYTDYLGTHASSVDVTKGAPTASLGQIPLGTTVTLSEGARTGAPAVVAWSTPIWSASGGSLTDNGDGTASVAVTSSTAISVALENPTTQILGGFSLHKAVTGSAAGSVPASQDFVVTYTYPGQASPQTLIVSKGSPDAAVGSLPVGTVVTIAEATPTGAPADVSWGTPTWSATGGSITDNGDGTATFAIGTSAISVTLTNPTTQLSADLSLTKSVTGSAAGSVAGGYDFTVNYGWTDSAGAHTSSATVSKSSPTVSLGSIPLGSIVTLSEVAPSGASPDVNWQTPVWTATGASIVDNGDGSASLTVSATGTVSIGLENPTSQLLGGFSVTKVVSGSGAASVPDGTSFTVTYTYPGQPTPQTLVVTKGSPTASVANLPLGTVVTLSESAPTGVSAVSWGTPTWSSNVTTNGDGTATFTVASTPVGVTLTNPATQLFGRFSITKAVTGAANGFVTPGYTFTGTYTYPGQATPGTFSLEAGQTWTSPINEQIPAGTVVTITEDAPSGGIPSTDSWMTPILSIATVPFGANGSGDVTMDPGTTVAVDLENPTVVSPTVTIHKGDGSGTTIDNEADTMPDATYYAPGETKTIVFRVTNTGPEALRNVTLGDNTLSGGVVDNLVWTFPDGSTTTATKSGNDWSATWPATFGAGPTLWAVGDVITGSATLTVGASDAPHVDRARVDAIGATSGLPVTASNDYNAYTAQIQIIHYDGNRPDPVVKDSSGNWIIPTNPLIDVAQDANDTSHAVKYPAGQPQQVRWVITNVGTTFLTHLTMSQLSSFGPQYADWTFDMTSIGGTQSAYNFITDGPWDGVFPPGASFFGSGPLTLNAQDTHEDTTQVVGAIVIPATNSNGVPTQLPTLAFGGGPVFYTLPNGSPRIVRDSDPFNARAVPTLAFTGVDQGAITLATWIAASGVLLGLVLLVVPKRRRRRTARG